MKPESPLHWMNRHPTWAFILLNFIGFLIHLAYELIHPDPFLGAIMVLVGAGVAGLAVDHLLMKGEKKTGEID